MNVLKDTFSIFLVRKNGAIMLSYILKVFQEMIFREGEHRSIVIWMLQFQTLLNRLNDLFSMLVSQIIEVIICHSKPATSFFSLNIFFNYRINVGFFMLMKLGSRIDKGDEFFAHCFRLLANR
jgi:hypothetical protein